MKISPPPHNVLHMTDEQLLALDKIGFIPGPSENETDFQTRVAATKKKFEEGSWLPNSHWDWARAFLTEQFHVKPLYICAFYSKRGLAPWQGAVSWLNHTMLDSIQIHPGLRKGSYLGLYSLDEILAHEAVHFSRSAFDESSFEEFFAYMSSSKKWRQIFGPIIESPWEVWPFFLSSIGACLWPPLYFGACLWLSIGLARLFKRHFTLNRAAKSLLKEIGDIKKVRAILFRLTDREISLFAKGLKIREYEKKQTCLRWRAIRAGYL